MKGKARRILRHVVMILNGVLVASSIIAFSPTIPYSVHVYLSKVWMASLVGNVIANSFLALYLNDKEASRS